MRGSYLCHRYYQAQGKPLRKENSSRNRSSSHQPGQLVDYFLAPGREIAYLFNISEWLFKPGPVQREEPDSAIRGSQTHVGSQVASSAVVYIQGFRNCFLTKTFNFFFNWLSVSEFLKTIKDSRKLITGSLRVYYPVCQGLLRVGKHLCWSPEPLGQRSSLFFLL